MVEINVLATVTNAIGKDAEGVVPLVSAIQQLFESASTAINTRPNAVELTPDSKISVKKLQNALGDLTNTYVGNVIDLKFPIVNVNNKQQLKLEIETKEKNQILFSDANSRVQKAILGIQADLEKLTSEREQLTSQNKIILNELSALDKEAATLINAHEIEVQGKLKEKEAIIGELNKIKDTLQAEIGDLKAAAGNTGTGAEELFLAEKKILERKNAELKDELKILDSLNVNATFEKNNLKTEITKLEKNLEDSDAQFTDFINIEKNKSVNLQKSIDEKVARIREMEQEVEKFIKETDIEIGNLRAQLRIYLMQLDKSKQECAAEMANLKEKLTQQEEKIKSLVSEKKDKILQRTQALNKQTREEFVKELENERKIFKSYKVVTDNVRKTLQDEIEDLQQSLVHVLENKDNNEQEKKNLKELVENLKKNNLELNKENASWEQFADMLETVNKKHIGEKSILNKEIEKNKELIQKIETEQKEKSVNAAILQNEINERVRILETDLKNIENLYREQFIKMEKLNIEHANKLANIGEIISDSDAYYFDVINEQQQEILNLQGVIIENSKALEEINKKLNEKKESYDELDAFSSELYNEQQQTLLNLQEKIREREEFLNTLVYAHEKNFNENIKSLDLLKQQHTGDLSKIKAKNVQNAKQYIEIIAEQKNKIGAFEKVIFENQQMLVEFEKKLNKIKENNKSLLIKNINNKKQIEKNNLEMVAQTKKISDLTDKLNSQSKIIQQLKNEKNSLRGKESVKTIEITKLSEQLKSAKEKQAELELNLQTQIYEINALQAKNKSILEEIKTALTLTEEYIQLNTKLHAANLKLEEGNNKKMFVITQLKNEVEKRTIIMNDLYQFIDLLKDIILRQEITPEVSLKIRNLLELYKDEHLGQVINGVLTSLDNEILKSENIKNDVIVRARKNTLEKTGKSFSNVMISLGILGLWIMAFSYINALQISELTKTENLLMLPAAKNYLSSEQITLATYTPNFDFFSKNLEIFTLIIAQGTISLKESALNIIETATNSLSSLRQVITPSSQDKNIQVLRNNILKEKLSINNNLSSNKELIINVRDIYTNSLITNAEKKELLTKNTQLQKIQEHQLEEQFQKHVDALKIIQTIQFKPDQSVNQVIENRSYVENTINIISSALKKVAPPQNAASNIDGVLDDVYELLEKIKNIKTNDEVFELNKQLNQNPNKIKILFLYEKLAKLYPPCT